MHRLTHIHCAPFGNTAKQKTIAIFSYEPTNYHSLLFYKVLNEALTSCCFNTVSWICFSLTYFDSLHFSFSFIYFLSLSCSVLACFQTRNRFSSNIINNNVASISANGSHSNFFVPKCCCWKICMHFRHFARS